MITSTRPRTSGGGFFLFVMTAALGQIESNLSEEKKSRAAMLQPLTFGGVARFATERFGRLMLAQFLFAAGAASCMVALLALAYFPIIDQAIAALPNTGAILNGELQWPEGSRPVSAQNRVLGLAVEPADDVAGLAADLRVIVGRTKMRISGLTGYIELDYPNDRFLPLNRQALTPSWGAWRPVILLGVGVSVLIGVWTSWIALATLYFIPVRLFAMIAGRQASLVSSWKLAAACLLPGSLIMDGAIILYMLTPLSPVGIGLAFVFHILLGWVYAGIAPFKLPKAKGAVTNPENPFARETERVGETASTTKKNANPFAGNSRSEK